MVLQPMPPPVLPANAHRMEPHTFPVFLEEGHPFELITVQYMRNGNLPVMRLWFRVVLPRRRNMYAIIASDIMLYWYVVT